MSEFILVLGRCSQSFVRIGAHLVIVLVCNLGENERFFFPKNSIFMDFGLIEKIFAFLHFPFLTCRDPTPEDPRFPVIPLNHNLKWPFYNFPIFPLKTHPIPNSSHFLLPACYIAYAHFSLSSSNKRPIQARISYIQAKRSSSSSSFDFLCPIAIIW